jgi:RNA polymerase sigma-70 factor (sigma-E family)
MGEAPDEFATAYPALYGRAYRVGYRLLGSRAEAEDVAQEALTRALTRWRRVGAYAEAWVVRTATNLAIDAVRRRKRHSEEVTEHMGHDPYAEERLDLTEALARLPRRQREVVAMRFLGDFSEYETAVALGLSNGTVKSHTARGLASLRVRLQLDEGSG